MTLLLDTRAFYWCLRRGVDVPAHVRLALEAAPRRYVSDASAYEVSLKVRLGKFPGARPLCERWSDALAALPAIALPVATPHALAAGAMEWDHKDPFDRLLAAQAITEGLTLVTADRAFASAPGVDILRW
ncbi:type II toxin-antitoxin system VapC family toxin [Nocardioides ginsengisoli]|uniref:Type II toxin-antitoxin system VapC family toxin n=1 Tax=Nocardioides ginsengisoli TaxID=363868 RepID=A0ABW3W6X1_9ACTN